MMKSGMLLGCVLLFTACGQSKNKATTANNAESTPPPDTTAAAYEAPPAEAEPAKDMQSEAAPPLEPEAPPPVVATAEVKLVNGGDPVGTLTFEKGADGQIAISGEFMGLKKKSVHAFYIHEGSDCGGKAKKVGPHLNPTKAKHGPPASSQRHAGDFGNITVDDNGTATFSMTTDSVTLEPDRPDSVLNRTVVIHASKDDAKGSGGAPLACGVVVLKS